MKRLMAIILLAASVLSACKQEIIPNQVPIPPTQWGEPQEVATKSSSTEATTPAETKFTTPEETEVTEPDNPVQTTEIAALDVTPTTAVTEPTEAYVTTDEDSPEETPPVQPTVLPPTTETVESTQLPPTEPIQETVSALEAINTAELEAYGREYASEYGYWGNPDTGFATGAGYYPPSRVTIRTMEDGYERIRELVDTQYAIDVATGRPITAIVDGVEVHRKINIYIQNTDDPNVFLLYCFYGGD